MANPALKILVYSDNPNTRDQARSALGRRIHPDLPELTYLEVATAPAVVSSVDAGGIDLAIRDGEATPAGGMGLAKQLKDEVANCPPIVVLTGRPDDAWVWRPGVVRRLRCPTRSTRSGSARQWWRCCRRSGGTLR